MKTFLIIASVLAILWVLFFILSFVSSVEVWGDPEDITRVKFTVSGQSFAGKILSWKMFWVIAIRTRHWKFQLPMLLTGAPIWGFVLYIIIESMIISGKKFYRWLNWYRQ